jgi:hypothetical protein
MRTARIIAVLATACFAACKCGSEKPATLDAGHGDGGGQNGDGGGVGGDTGTGPGSSCAVNGTTCDRNTTVCCSGMCINGMCEVPLFCKGPGETCMTGNDCCTLACTNGTCGAKQCAGDGQHCAAASDCCSTICGAGGMCQAVPPGPAGTTCKTLGESCAAGSDCCSTNCQGKVCVRAYSCQANGDICHQNSECCGNDCSATGGAAGRCLMVSGGGAGGCIQDGNPCPNGGTNCCSRICVDLGSGVPVCQLAGGCRLTGDWCANTNECCGGGMNPNGTVSCNGAPVGRCDNGQACNGVGNICGAPVLPDGGSINASQDCCDGKKTVCKVDSAGIPRCFGGCPNGMCPMGCPTGYDGTKPGCCIAQGQACQFRDQCCDLVPCVPGAGGGLVCAPTPMCKAVGETCTVGATGANACCMGTECAPSTQPNVDVCRMPVANGDGGIPGDGGHAADAGSCIANGQNCTTASMCCSQICTMGMCGAQRACQPGGGSCTSSADCCAGLMCAIMPGSTSGMCEAGGNCSASGQSCSTSQPCCSGLSCEDTAGAACSGASACVCRVLL